MWNTLRIFVSSTFLDMRAERNYLVRVVFPELRERCAKRCLHITEVDLRWGVTEAEASDGRTLAICMDEIDLCRPYFVGLVGERYGLVLSRYLTPDDERYEWLKECPSEQSITALEIYYGALRNRSASSRSLFYFRDPSFISQVPVESRSAFECENAAAKEKLERLKIEIRRKCKVLENYQVRYKGVDPSGHVVLSGLENFGTRVLEDLWTNINQDYPEQSTVDDELQAERTYHEQFLERRSKIFIGRRDLLKSLNDYADGEQTLPLVVAGDPGQGKSALLSKFIVEYRPSHPGSRVVSHFAGCSPNSRNVIRTLSRLCQELVPTVNASLPEEYEPLRDVFRNRLETAGGSSRVVLVIDGMNQLMAGTNAAPIDWLPKVLPRQVHMILSTTPGDWLDSVRMRKPAPAESVLPPLNGGDRARLVRELLSQHRKRLNEMPGQDQLSLLLGKSDSNSALYLTVACEELRVAGDFSTLTKSIQDLPESVTALFAALLKRLENDHGEPFVPASLSALACSRGGLGETELTDLIGDDAGQPIPRLAWSRFFRALDAYLQRSNERGEGLLNFFHEQLAQAVIRLYLPAQDLVLKQHITLAKFFTSRADPTADETWQGGDPRAFEHVVYHLALGNDRGGLSKTLLDFRFLRAKTFATRIYSVIEDFALPGAAAEPCLGLVAGALRLSAGVIGPDPTQIAGQLIGRLLSRSESGIRALVQAARQAEDACWLCPLLPGMTEPGGPLVKVLTHDKEVRDIAVSPDGKRALAATDTLLTLWDLDSGTTVLTLRGHSGIVREVAMSADGRRAISASDDHTLKVWDLECGTAIWTLPGHIWFAKYPWLRWLGRLLSRKKDMAFKVGITDVDISDDGKRAVSASKNIIKVWDLDRGVEHFRFSGRVGIFSDSLWFSSLAMSGDGLWAVSGCWDAVRVWDLERRCLKRVLRWPLNTFDIPWVETVDISGDGQRVIAGWRDSIATIWNLEEDAEPLQLRSEKTAWATTVAITPDGSKAVTGAKDKEFAAFEVWDANSGTELRLIKGAEGEVGKAAITADGNRVLTERINTVEVWDLSVNTECGISPAHENGVECLAVGGDGRRGLSGSRGGDLKVWNLTSGMESCAIEAHTHAIEKLTMTADGAHGASVAIDSTLKIWDLETGAKLRELPVSTQEVSGLGGFFLFDLFPAGRQDVIAVQYPDMNRLNVLRLSTVEANEPPLSQDLKGHDSRIIAVATSDDGLWLISASEDSIVIVWDLVSGREYRRVKMLRRIGRQHQLRLAERTSLAVSTAEDESVLTVWDPVTGRVFHELTGHSTSVKSMAISSDLKRMVSVSWDRTCRLWDLARGAALASFTLENYPNSCCISPTGDIVGVGDTLGNVQFFSVRGSFIQ